MGASGRPEPVRIIGADVEFVDDEGVPWTVTECDARNIPGTHGLHCLIFHSCEAVRRVWQYPAGWRYLGTSRLIALSWSR
jgi:hypothetical protein